MAPSLKVYLRVLREIALKHTGQRTGNICLAGMKSPLWPSQSFWERGLLDSFHISFVLMYKDFSVQVNLPCTHVDFFKAKGMPGLQLSSPCGCRRTLGTRDQLHGRALPSTQGFLQLPIQQGTSKIGPGCVWEPHLPEEQCLWPIWSFLVGLFAYHCPAWSPSRWVLTIFKNDLSPNPTWIVWQACFGGCNSLVLPVYLQYLYPSPQGQGFLL